MALHFLKHLATTRSKKLLLADSLGAVLTLCLLTMLILWGSDLVGIPMDSLYLLAVVALLLAVVSFISYRVAGMKWPNYLKGIAFANLCYCILTVAVLYLSRQTLSIYGWLCFGGELTVITIGRHSSSTTSSFSPLYHAYLLLFPLGGILTG